MISLWPDSRGEPRVVLGPHCNFDKYQDPLFITALIICGGLVFFVLYNYYTQFSLFWKIIVTLSGLGFVGTYIVVGLSDPGIAKAKGRPSQEEKEAFRFCHICGLLRDRQTEHCGDCDVCIEGFDHHCPWVGKCVGRKNLKAFYAFLIMTFGNIIVLFVATATVNIAHPKAAKAF
jgi:multisubunit Na+/H+ antiporter MnhF subunit